MKIPSSPDLLSSSPEMAALDILDATLSSVVWALMAAHPEIESDDWLLHPTPELCLADAISSQAIALQNAVERYRRRVLEQLRPHPVPLSFGF